MVGQPEVGAEGRSGVPVGSTVEHEGVGLVLPPHGVEVEESGELALCVVGEAGVLVREPDGLQGSAPRRGLPGAGAGRPVVGGEADLVDGGGDGGGVGGGDGREQVDDGIVDLSLDRTER